MAKRRTPISVNILTKEEQRDGLEVPDTTTPDEAEERVQVNISKYVVEKLIKGWLDKGAQPGTIKDVCERAVRLWLTIFANVKRDGESLRFFESQTGQDLRRLAVRLDRDLGEAASPSVKQAYIARIGAQIAVCLLRTPGVQNEENDLLHEVFAAAERTHRLIGDEVVDRLRLAASVLTATDETTARELKKGYTGFGR